MSKITIEKSDDKFVTSIQNDKVGSTVYVSKESIIGVIKPLDMSGNQITNKKEDE